MLYERDIEMVRIAHKAAADWRAMGGQVVDLDDGLKLCFGADGPCVTVSDSTLRKLGRWVLSLLRVIGRKLGLGV